MCVSTDGSGVCYLSQYRRTALHEASENGHEQCVKLLLEYKADPNIEDEVRYIVVFILMMCRVTDACTQPACNTLWHCSCMRYTGHYMDEVGGCGVLLGGRV